MLNKPAFFILICLSLCAVSIAQTKPNDSKPLIAPVCLDGKSVYINRSGEVVLKTPFNFSSAQYFSDGLAIFKQDEKYGFIDETGKIVIEPTLDAVESFFESFAITYKNNKAGFIDKTGKLAFPLFYDKVQNFSNGYAVVGVENGLGEDDMPNYKVGFIDRTGEIAIGKTKNKRIGKFDDADDFAEGLAPVKIGGKWGYVNEKEQTVIKFAYKEAKPFAEGLAPVAIDGDKWGFIDKTGKFVIQPRFTDADIFSEGLAAVSTHKYGIYATEYIDRSGKTVFKIPNSSLAGRFKGGITSVPFSGGDEDQYWDVLINNKGKIILKNKNHAIIVVENGIALFGTAFGISYIDKMGRYIWDSENQNAETLSKCRDSSSAASPNEQKDS